MQETLATTKLATKRIIILGSLFLAILDTAFGAYLGIHHYDKLTSSWAGIYLLVALAGLAAVQIEAFRLARKDETSVSAFGLVVRMYIVFGLLLFALAEALR